MGKHLDEYYHSILLNIKKHQSLWLKFAFDSERNPISYLENNLVTYRSHINDVVFGNNSYNIQADTKLVTLILNYISIVKSYLNRKKRAIEKNFSYEYKDEILKIFQKYWKAKRYKTILDRLIELRDKFEHDELFGFGLRITNDKNVYKEQILIDDIDISILFYEAYIELKKMNSEIVKYINQEIDKLNLTHCLHFIYAFHREFKDSPYQGSINIIESQDEIDRYNKLVQELKQSN